MQGLISIMGLLFLVVTVHPLNARTLADVELPEEVVLEMDGSRLLLNGAGVVRHLFTDVLVGALYLPRRQRDAGDVMDLPQPARVQIHVLYRNLAVKDLEAAWLACLENPSNSVQSERLSPRLRALMRLIPDLAQGDVLAVDLLPGQGAWLYLNGDLLGVAAGDEISRALLVAWIGDSPVDGDVKRAMLGSG
jgi:hypothetical protein